MIKPIKRKLKGILNFMSNIYFKIRNRYNPLLKSTEGVSKLNLGSGETYLEGYLNVDIDASRKVDVLIDFKIAPKIIRNDSIDEILMIHSISYLAEWDARQLFMQLRTKLKKNGKLILEFPDSYKCATSLIAVSENLNTKDYMEAIRGFYAFGMEDYHGKKDYFPYKFGWSSEYLIQTLLDLNYSQAWYEEPQTHGARSWRDSRVIALK